MYELSKPDLLKRHSDQLLIWALDEWKAKKLDNDVIADKIEKMVDKMERSTVREFIAMFNAYAKRRAKKS